MSRSFAVLTSWFLLFAVNDSNFAAALSLDPSNKASTRRSFLKVPTALVTTTGVSSFLVWTCDLPQQEEEQQAHGAKCPCASCASMQMTDKDIALHKSSGNCECRACRRRSYGPPSANAYEFREIGGADRSAETAAMNIQARETNARLLRDGFKLDSREEEASRLSDALSSYSYSGTSGNSRSSQGNSKSGRGYAAAARDASKSEANK